MGEVERFLADLRSTLAVAPVEIEIAGDEMDVGDSADVGRSGRPSRRDRTLAAFELLEEIERGGQGVVYRARQRAAGRTVAVKLIHVDTTRNRARLEREARLAARLRHPNIVTLLDCGELADGRFGLAMEWVDGKTLDAWAERVRGANDLTPRARRDRLLAAMVGLCDALDHAHRHGVIHRDLKPGNVLVDGSDQPRVLDFGIAIESHRTDEPRMTMTGEIACTLCYAAPELLGDERAAADTRSDVYSLGVILHEILTGRRPHAGTVGLAEFVDRIRRCDPTPPSASSDGRIPIAPDLDTIVLKALARDPDRRYPSAAGLRDDLRHLLRGEPIDARRDSFAYLFRMAMRRHRWGVAAASLVVIAIVGGGAVAAWGWLTAREAALRELSERARLREETYRFAGVSDLLRQIIPRGDPTPSDPNSSETHRLLNAIGDTLETSAFSDDPAATVATRIALAEVSADRGGLRRAEVEYRQALRILRDAGEAASVRGARVMTQMARLLARRSSVPEATTLIDEAIPLLRRLLGASDPETIEAEIVRAEILLAKSDRSGAIAQLDAVHRRMAAGDSRSHVREARVRLAALGTDEGEQAASLALELLRGELLLRADGDERLTEALAQLAERGTGELAERAGRVARALRAGSVVTIDPVVLEELVAIKRALLGPEDRDLVETYVHAARRAFEARRFEKAEEMSRAALSIAVPDGQPKNVAEADLRMSWFESACRRPDPGPALDEAMSVAADFRRLLADNGPLHLITRLREIARVCAFHGRPEVARTLCAEAIARCEVISPDGPHLAWTRAEVASIEMMLGDFDAARPLVIQGLAGLAKADRSWSFHLGMTQIRLGIIESSAGNQAASIAAFEEGLRTLRAGDLPAPDREAMEAIVTPVIERVRRGERVRDLI